MVSSKDAKEALRSEQEHVGPLTLSMVSSKGAPWSLGRGCYHWLHRRTPRRLGTKEVGNSEHHTHSRIWLTFHMLFAAKKEW